MVFKNRNTQHPLIVEDSMPVHRSSNPWRKFFMLLIFGLFLAVVLMVRGI